MLISVRNPIECAFGRLKARSQVLTKKNGFQTWKDSRYNIRMLCVA